VVRSTCSWSIDSQWLEPFVKAFCKNDSLDDVLLHGSYVLIFCCGAFRRHDIGGENRAVTRSHSVHHRTPSATCMDQEYFVNFSIRCLWIFRTTSLCNQLPAFEQTARSCGTGPSETNQPESVDRSESDQPKTFLRPLLQKLWTFRTSSRDRLKNSGS